MSKDTVRWASFPSCPVCESRQHVEALPEAIDGRHLFCTGCCTVFAGTDAEWRANEGRRRLRKRTPHPRREAS